VEIHLSVFLLDHTMMTTIATERLLLRPHLPSDAAILVRELNNYAVSRWTARIPYPYTMADAEDFLKICAGTQPGTLRMAVIHGGVLIGGIGYERSVDGRSAEIGYWLAERQWGTGFGKEAAAAMTGHAFEVAAYDELQAGYQHGNEASRRILEGLGFRKTGDVMNYSLAAGAETPVTRLSLSRADWQTVRGRR
jgi:RimJ/RimL family protein N-acetyltransferase